MTLLEKLLRRQNYANKSGNMSFKSYLSSSRNHEGRFVLDKSEVRLVIFKDHDKFGRKLLYDSFRCEMKDCADEHLLGELLFGNKVMVKKVNSAIKVHILKDPPQFLIAKVFIPSSANNESECQSRTCGLFDWYCFHDLPQSDLASSTSLPIPLRDDLIKSYDASNVGSEPSYKASLTRWTPRNRDPSEMALTSSLAIANTVSCIKNGNIQDHDPMISGCMTQPLPLNQRPVKLGIGITFLNPENDFAAEFMRKFFFSHVSILEGYILKIKNILESPEFLERYKVCKTDKVHSFFQEMTEDIIQSLLNFYSFPRIQNPVWLSLSLPSVSSSSTSPSLSFMREFVFLSDKCYTRNTKFFLGSLLTAVLTHHLSWVSSMPSACIPDESYLSKTAFLEGHPPVNPLLKQLRDLCGAVGFPCCISKTVVVGKRADLVRKFLFILSYFIRCNDLFEILEQDENLPIKETSLLSSTTDSELFKDSGFSESEIDDTNSTPNKFKKLDMTFHSTSKKCSSYISKTSSYLQQSANANVDLQNIGKLENDVEEVTCISRHKSLNVLEDKVGNELVMTSHFATNEEYLSILPIPNKDTSGNKKIIQSPAQCQSCDNGNNLTIQEEESRLLKKIPCEPEIVWNESHVPQELKFDVNELLYEIMEDLYGNESLETNTIILEDTLNLHNSDESYKEIYSDSRISTLGVNEPSCLPDGPIKEQLLFKLDLIGSATTFDVLSEPRVYTPNPNLRNSTSLKLTNMPLPEVENENENQCLLLDESNLGRSLLGDFCRSFTPEFVLHGTSERAFLSPPFNDLHQDLKTSLKSPILNEPADAALFIVADIDNWSVQLFSLKSLSPDEALTPQPIISSQLVLRLIESSFELSKFNSSPAIWLNLIEDQLNNIYMKSRILAEFIQVHGQFCSQQLARLLGYDVSDLPLLLAVAGIHSPRILPSLTNSQKHL